MMAALLLREGNPELPLSESHPKAWLWLAGVATREKKVDGITGFDLGAWLAFRKEVRTGDERDAAIASLSAWAMIRQPQEWHDLYLASGDADTYSPLNPQPQYWMPTPE
jgi:hypothetical protein